MAAVALAAPARPKGSGRQKKVDVSDGEIDWEEEVGGGRCWRDAGPRRAVKVGRRFEAKRVMGMQMMGDGRLG